MRRSIRPTCGTPPACLISSKNVVCRSTPTSPNGPPASSIASRSSVTAESLSHRFQALRERAGVRPAITIDSFRHFWISEMLMAGVDVLLVARMAGTSVAMIERVYGHFRNQSYQEAQARLDRRAGGTGALTSAAASKRTFSPHLGRAGRNAFVRLLEARSDPRWQTRTIPRLTELNGSPGRDTDRRNWMP